MARKASTNSRLIGTEVWRASSTTETEPRSRTGSRPRKSFQKRRGGPIVHAVAIVVVVIRRQRRRRRRRRRSPSTAFNLPSLTIHLLSPRPSDLPTVLGAVENVSSLAITVVATASNRLAERPPPPPNRPTAENILMRHEGPLRTLFQFENFPSPQTSAASGF